MVHPRLQKHAAEGSILRKGPPQLQREEAYEIIDSVVHIARNIFIQQLGDFYSMAWRAYSGTSDEKDPASEDSIRDMSSEIFFKVKRFVSPFLGSDDGSKVPESEWRYIELIEARNRIVGPDERFAGIGLSSLTTFIKFLSTTSDVEQGADGRGRLHDLAERMDGQFQLPSYQEKRAPVCKIPSRDGQCASSLRSLAASTCGGSQTSSSADFEPQSAFITSGWSQECNPIQPDTFQSRSLAFATPQQLAIRSWDASPPTNLLYNGISFHSPDDQVCGTPGNAACCHSAYGLENMDWNGIAYRVVRGAQTVFIQEAGETFNEPQSDPQWDVTSPVSARSSWYPSAIKPLSEMSLHVTTDFAFQLEATLYPELIDVISGGDQAIGIIDSGGPVATRLPYSERYKECSNSSYDSRRTHTEYGEPESFWSHERAYTIYG